MKRHFVIHAGPTNSGKTHKALEAFYNASSGIYCAPLRMLAQEIYMKSNTKVSRRVIAINVTLDVHEIYKCSYRMFMYQLNTVCVCVYVL